MQTRHAMGILGAGLLCLAGSAHAALCDGTQPRVTVDSRPGNSVRLMWVYDGPADCTDIYNIRAAIIGQAENQFEVGGGWCPSQGNNNGFCRRDIPVVGDKPYIFKVQACHTRTAQSSSCSQWGEVRLLPYGEGSCKDGYVWREAFSTDHVCVSPEERDRARQQNGVAASRVSPNDHTYGPDTCTQGYVWREANPSDHVCVTPQERQQVRNDNDQSGNRSLHYH